MKKTSLHLLALCGCLAIGGCIGPDMNYTGKTFPATAKPAVLKNGITLEGYEEMGRCSVSGSYSDYTFEQLEKDVIAKAEAVGADAVYISNKTVVPDGDARLNQLMDTSPTNKMLTDDNSASNVNMLSQQLESRSTAFTKPESIGPVPIYNRVIQAIFLKKK